MNETSPKTDIALWIAGGLALAVLFVFGQTLRYDFISYDDPLYILQNEVVRQGLTWAGIKWAFTTASLSMWHPLTLLSHMLDVELFGLRPGLHHFVNVLLHATNAVLLFIVLRTMTGTTWRSALVAALFALHPLRAESVAWVSERKDVLSALFWMLAMLAYASYVRRRSLGRYALVAVCMALGLLAKPMVVTLPFALLLLDYWPLRRVTIGGRDATDRRPLRALVVEKLPLFGLSVAASLASIWSQEAGGAMGALERYSLGVRLANAVAAYGMYLWTTFVPVNLAVIYPHPGGTLPAWQVTASAAVLLAVTLGALFLWRRFPYLFVGWFWFLGTLIPVIGIVQVGSAARADRYTYLPHIGLFVALVWLGGAAVQRRPRMRRVAVAAGAVVVVALAAQCYAQVGYWRNNVTLFKHAVAVSPLSAKARFNLGIGYAASGQLKKAKRQFERAVEMNPGNVDMRKNLGAALLDLGRPQEAEEYFREIALDRPYEPEYQVDLAIALYRQGKYAEAIFRAQEALRIDPEYEKAHLLIERAKKSLEPSF